MRPREGEKAANRGRKEGVKRVEKGWKTAAYLQDKAVNLSVFVEIRRRSSAAFAARAEPLRTPERGLLRPGNSPAAPEGEGVNATRRRPPLGERSRPPFPMRTPSKADGSRTRAAQDDLRHEMRKPPKTDGSRTPWMQGRRDAEMRKPPKTDGSRTEAAHVKPAAWMRTLSKADGSRTAPTEGRPRGASPPSAGSEGRNARMRPLKGSATGFRRRERRLGQEVDRRADNEQGDDGDLHAAGVPPEMLALSVLNHLLRPSERRGTPRC